jgi:hypothetical protein
MKSICGILSNGVPIAVALVALLALTPAPNTRAAQAQQPAPTASQVQETPEQTIIRTRIAEGYSAVGPLELKGVSSSELVIGAVPGNPKLTVSLTNKNVSVMDESGNGLTTGSLAVGTNVIIFQKQNDIVIYVVPAPPKETRNANKK